ncbi:hypothetical protein H5T58_02235 [Candidatus Parcubacteria bacterium]|nr:hypothetical protein [Candidatus Parcubacteria bacterium]
MKGKIREARQQFHQDIENVRALISDAKVAVRNAAVALAQIEKLTTRTPIPQVSP